MAQLLFLVLATAFVSGTMSEILFSHSASMDADNNFMVFWDFDEERIVFEVSVRTRGYIGFGVSPNGAMAGADIVMGGVDDAGNVYFMDFHGLGNFEPEVDKSQDWYVISGRENQTHTTLRFGRPLDTCDTEDLVIKTETVRLIWSYSDDDMPSSGRAKYHNQRGTKSVYLLSPKTPPSRETEEGSLDLSFLNSQVSVPSDHTTYWCQAFSVPVSTPHQVIKFEPAIQPGHEYLVHHIIIYGCFNESRVSSIGNGHACYHRNMPDEWWACNAVMFAWAIGGGAFVFPDHVGYPFGVDGDPDMLLMETHFDNPQRLQDMVDSSGLRMTLIPKSRPHDAGILSVGSLVWKTLVIPPNFPNFRVEGHCHKTCLEQALRGQSDSIHVIGGILHSHLLGASMKVRHFRSGIELPNILRDENYDFNLQETRPVEPKVTVLPGDHLTTECIYDSRPRKGITFGGQSTIEEMCLGYLIYYPKIELTNCETTVHPRTLARFAIEKAENLPSNQDMRRFSWVRIFLGQINWQDPTVRADYQNISLSRDLPVVVRCQQGPTQYQVQGTSQNLPEIYETLPEESICEMNRTRSINPNSSIDSAAIQQLGTRDTDGRTADMFTGSDATGTPDAGLDSNVNLVTAVVKVVGRNFSNDFSLAHNQSSIMKLKHTLNSLTKDKVILEYKNSCPPCEFFVGRIFIRIFAVILWRL